MFVVPSGVRRPTRATRRAPIRGAARAIVARRTAAQRVSCVGGSSVPALIGRRAPGSGAAPPTTASGPTAGTWRAGPGASALPISAMAPHSGARAATRAARRPSELRGGGAAGADSARAAVAGAIGAGGAGAGGSGVRAPGAGRRLRPSAPSSSARRPSASPASPARRAPRISR
jgi:hypothetical protein